MTHQCSRVGVHAAWPVVVCLVAAARVQVMETFNKIGAASTTHLGLETLYNLLEEHPTFPVEDLLSRTSEPFRNYIDKGLHKVPPPHPSWEAMRCPCLVDPLVWRHCSWWF